MSADGLTQTLIDQYRQSLLDGLSKLDSYAPDDETVSVLKSADAEVSSLIDHLADLRDLADVRL